MINSLLKKLFGDKATKERKEYQPIIDKCNEYFAQFAGLTDDELRQKTFEFQSKIKEATAELELEITNLQSKTNDPQISIDEKENLFNQIDQLSKDVNEKIETVLIDILPEAFAVIKETSRRWNENSSLNVLAQDFDKALSQRKDGITIDGDRAIWHNEWTAAGAWVKWSMVHYDVQ